MLRWTRLLVLLACGCTAAAERRGDTVILASGADLQSANPLLTVHPLARQVQRYALLVTLVRSDEALQPAPYLARRWEWSPHRTTLTLRLYSGLRWHDGAPTTARDAAWTLDAARDPAVGYPRGSDLATLVAAEAPDDTTLVLRFSRPQVEVPDVLTDLALVPAHLLDTVPRDALRRAAWNRRPVGNGPFRFVRHEPNRRWVFEANPDFPAELGGPPRLRRLVVAVVDEPTTKLAALTAGELDLAGIHPAHADFVRRDPRLTVVDYPLLFTYAVVLNLRRPPFDRLEARRAVANAIDREAIVRGALFGFGTPATEPIPEFPRSSRPADLPLRTSARPIEPAASSAPFPVPPFELLTVGAGEAALEQMLQAQLGAAGIRATIRQLELSTYLDRVQGPHHDFQAAVMGVSGDLGLGHLATLLRMAGLEPQGGTETQLRLFADSLPAIFLYHARGVQGMNRRLQGVHMDLRGELVTLTQWHVRDRERHRK
jgi:peptide/nickel transport system substrate-binding protein